MTTTNGADLFVDAIRARLATERNLEPVLTDPVEWANKKLGLFLWSKQREIAQSVKDNPRTAVKSCHDAGKSFIASVIAAWWIDTHPPGTAIVISSAPTYKQVHAILWEEIRSRHKRGNLPGRVLQSDEWKLDDGTLVGQGRKPADTDEDGFQGIHRRYVLAILDEACGIPDSLWTGVEAITTNADCRILAIGNPTDPATEFGTVCKPGSGWSTIQISAFDTPNFTDELVPEDLKPMLLDPAWVEDKKRRYGEDSAWYTARVLGEFPEVGDDALISPKLIEAAQQRALDAVGEHRLAVDVARFGSDETIVLHTAGPVARVIGSYSKQATTATTGKVIAHARELEALEEIRVDGVGVGGGVVDQLAENPEVTSQWAVLDMQAGMAALDNRRFVNARAEWYWGLREIFQDGDIDIDPTDDDMAAQLGSIKYKHNSRGLLQIESKDDMKKRGLPSPDRADALMLARAHVPVVIDETYDAEDLDDELAGAVSYLGNY